MTDVGYYDNMKQELWEGDYDAVLFELIIPSDLAHTDSRGRRRPRSGVVTAAPREQALARGLRLELQLDALGPDFEAAPTWQCADLSKEEIKRAVAQLDMQGYYNCYYHDVSGCLQ